MSFNWESESNVMVVRICMAIPFQLLIAIIYYEPQSDIRVKTFSGRNSPEFYMINFESRDRLLALFEDPVEKLWSFLFAMSFSVFPKSVSTNYEHLNFSKTFVVQFRASRYAIGLNRTCE